MMNRQGRSVRSGLMTKVLSFVLVLVMILGTVSGSLLMQGDRAYAAGDSKTAPVKTGTYQYASNENLYGNILSTDTYQYCDSLFMGSSYEVNRHLATLSAGAALASCGYYTDGNERDHASNSRNVKALLKKLGFSDIQTNTYYQREKEQDSMACILGRKTIKVGSKTYTLLAVIARSAGYKQEWNGNFNVGTGSMHQGFKAARDEVLRFTKNYIADKKIKGNLKVWVTGHSRGGAAANMLGGFFAEGGGGYFNNVKVDSKDVYCYSWATPGTIRTPVTKAEALSVAGYRGDADARYKYDSKGAAYTYSGADADKKIDPHTGVYRCIKNCAPGYDIITQLPPKSWGYDWYGEELPIKGDPDKAAATKAKMLTELNKFAPFAYKEYTQEGRLGENGDEDSYKWMTFDFATLGFAEIEDGESLYGPIGQEDMFYARINEGLAHRAATVKEYVEDGYQEMLRAVAGIYGMGITPFLEGLMQDQEAALKAAAFSYLSYAKERLITEDPELTETKAIAMTVEQLLEYISGKSIDPDTFTVDDFFELFAQYIVDNAEQYEVEPVEDTGTSNPVQNGELDPGDYDDQTIQVNNIEFKSKTAEEAFNAISAMIINAVPEEYKGMLPDIIEGFDPKQPIDSVANKQAIGNFVFSMLAMCAYGYSGKPLGPDATPEEQEKAEGEAKLGRTMIYMMLSMFMGDGDYKDIVDAIGKDDYDTPDGSANAGDFLKALMELLMVEKDEDGGILFKYNSVDAAATGYLKKIIDNGKEELLASGRYDSGSVYYRDVMNHCKTLKKRATQLRQLLMDLLFYEDGKTGNSAKDNIRMASTFASQASKVTCAHYNEIYVAWMRAQDSPIKYIKPALDVSKVSTKLKTGKKQMVVTWKAAADASDYQVAYRQVGKKWKKKRTGGKTQITVGKLKKHGLYEFKVRAAKQDGSDVTWGKWSKVDYRFYASAGAKVRADKKAAIVNAGRVEKATGYQVVYGTDKSLKKKTIRSFKGASKTRLRIKGLQSRKLYYVRTRPYKMYKGHKYIGILGAKKKAVIK